LLKNNVNGTDIKGNILVVIPSYMEITWYLEICNFTNIDPGMIRLFRNHRQESPLKPGKPCIVFCPYSLLQTVNDERLSWLVTEPSAFSAIIADEATVLSNPRSNVSVVISHIILYVCF
jgi:hypothetical protein